MKVLVLCCHGVFSSNGAFISDPRYERTVDPISVEVYLDHIKEAAKLIREREYDVLIVSGGYTKPQIEMSEAASYLKILRYLIDEKTAKNVLLEEYAKDTFENILFAMCRAYQVYKEFPVTLGILTWTWKGKRVQVIAEGLRIPDFVVIGVGNKNLSKTQTQIADEVKPDPLHRTSELAQKRGERNPWKKRNPYEGIPGLRKMFKVLNKMEKEGNPSLPAEFKFPWEN